MRWISVIIVCILSLHLVMASSYLIQVTPRSGNSFQPDTNFDYQFNFTTQPNCTSGGFVLNHSESVTTDFAGVGFVTITFPSNISAIPKTICEYRDGSLRKAHTINTQISDYLYGQYLNISKNAQVANITADYLFGDGSQITGNLSSATDFCVGSKCLSGVASSSGITWATAMNGTLAKTDTTNTFSENQTISNAIIHSETDGITRDFSNGCIEKVNTTGIYFIC